MYNSDGSFKSQKELETLLAHANISPNDPIVSYCTAGVRSGMMTIILRMAGFKNARNYDASFYGWALENRLPVE